MSRITRRRGVPIHAIEYQFFAGLEALYKYSQWPVEELWLKKWLSLKHPRLKSFFDAYDTLYPDRDRAFMVSCLERTDKFLLNDSQLTYGETLLSSYLRILKRLNLKPGDTLVDLGCGTGVLCFLAAALYPHIQVKGVDLIEGFVRNANTLLEQLQWDNLHFWVDNILTFDTSQANVYYATCTCFQEDFLAELAQTFEHAPPDTRIVTITHELEAPHLAIEETLFEWFSWGRDRAYLHRKMPS